MLGISSRFNCLAISRATLGTVVHADDVDNDGLDITQLAHAGHAGKLRYPSFKGLLKTQNAPLEFRGNGLMG